MRLFVGDDWAEDHHDIEVMDEAGKVLAKKRLPEGVSFLHLLRTVPSRPTSSKPGQPRSTRTKP